MLREPQNGIDEATVELGVQLAERSKDHLVSGREVRQVERYFLAYASPADVEPARATQPDNIREYRWWIQEELRSTPLRPNGRHTQNSPGRGRLIQSNAQPARSSS
jgi:hypothetical protein